jgi:hypothetical protein
MVNNEARVLNAGLAAHTFKVALPTLPIWRIGKHEVKFARWRGVVGQRRVLGAADDVVGCLTLALEQQVGFGDGVGLGVDLLAEEVGGDLLVMLLRKTLEGHAPPQDAGGFPRPG